MKLYVQIGTHPFLVGLLSHRPFKNNPDCAVFQNNHVSRYLSRCGSMLDIIFSDDGFCYSSCRAVIFFKPLRDIILRINEIIRIKATATTAIRGSAAGAGEFFCCDLVDYVLLSHGLCNLEEVLGLRARRGRARARGRDGERGALVKECGKEGQVCHRLLAGQQCRALPPTRQRRIDRSGSEGPAVHPADCRRRRNVNTQTSQMDNFITQKVDLILISPFEAAPLTPVVARAMKAGIPVIELDRKSLGDPGKDYTAFIGGDNFKNAEEAGKSSPTSSCPRAARSRCSRVCRARRRRSNGSTASRPG